MKHISFLLLLLLCTPAMAVVTYVEFYVQPTGSNLNSGDTSTDAADVTSVNGDWGNAAANRFTAASGTPFSAVTTDDYASVYLDAASVTAYVAKVTAVGGGGAYIELSATINAGTAPASGATGRSCKVGGAWAGPNGASGFPFNFAEDDLTGASLDAVRVNFKGDGNNATADYSVSAAMSHSLNGPLHFSGYTTTPGDGGFAVIDGGTSGTYYDLLTITESEVPSAVVVGFHNLIFQNHGGTGTRQQGIYINGSQTHWYRCVFREFSGSGFRSVNRVSLVSCEAYNCGKTNNSEAAIDLSGDSSNAFYTIAHDNAGSTTSGFRLASAAHALHCISESNGSHGFTVNGLESGSLQHCDAYNNGGSGIHIDTSLTGALVIENCNLIDNAAYGINLNGNTILGIVANNGFGAGTAANTSGTINAGKGIEVTGSVTYDANATPWTDPANGDFSISLAGAKNAGRGQYLYTAGTAYTVGTPDIGAAQSMDASGLNATTINFGTLNVQ